MADAIYYEGDRRPFLRAVLTRGGVYIDLTGASGVTFDLYRSGREAYAPIVSGTAAIADAPNGIVEYQWGAADLADIYGTFSGVFTVQWANGDETIPDGGPVEIVVRPKG